MADDFTKYLTAASKKITNSQNVAENIQESISKLGKYNFCFLLLIPFILTFEIQYQSCPVFMINVC